MQVARLLVTDLSESCREDLEIVCHGDHITYRFWSGSGGNQIVVRKEGGDVVVRVLRKKTWQSVKDAVNYGWKKFKGVVFGLFETLAQLTGIRAPFLALEGIIRLLALMKIRAYGSKALQ